MKDDEFPLDLLPEDFEGARQILRERGWHQGSSVGPGGRVCAARALNIVYGARTDRHIRPVWEQGTPNWAYVAHLMGIPPALNGVVEWNDLNSTTYEKVDERLARAASKLRAAKNL